MNSQYFGYFFVCSFSVGQEGKRQLKRKTKQECPQLGKAVNCILNCAFFLDSMSKNFPSIGAEQLELHCQKEIIHHGLSKGGK